MVDKVNKQELSDLDIKSLPDGFSFIFDGDNIVGVVAKIEYYQYIAKLIERVKEYVQDPKNKIDGQNT